MTDASSIQPNERIQKLLDEVIAYGETLKPIDVPGWTVRQPRVEEVGDDLITIVAQSKDGEFVPFVLPSSAEATIAVIEGEVELGCSVGYLAAHRFFVLGSGDERTITPRSHPTRIYCTFFRRGVVDDGPAVHPRAAC